MVDPGKIISKIFKIQTDADFSELAFQIFKFQYKNSTIYRKFVDITGGMSNSINSYTNIPCLPVDFFKSHKLTSVPEEDINLVFESSGTTGMDASRHYVYDPQIYTASFIRGFEHNFGPIDSYVFLGLLPSYLERQNSSLIYMVNELIVRTRDSGSGFYLYDFERLSAQIRKLRNSGKKIILWGVSFALLDFAEHYHQDYPDLIVIETGGMKGRKKEIIREDLHSQLSKGLGTEKIYSEYGMTEMLSQAYSTADKRFTPVPWLRVVSREINDPFSPAGYGRTGGLNIIDLANIYSCSFIATNDLGRVYQDGSFEVLGRFDNSDVRGCSLLV